MKFGLFYNRIELWVWWYIWSVEEDRIENGLPQSADLSREVKLPTCSIRRPTYIHHYNNKQKHKSKDYNKPVSHEITIFTLCLLLSPILFKFYHNIITTYHLSNLYYNSTIYTLCNLPFKKKLTIFVGKIIVSAKGLDWLRSERL